MNSLNNRGINVRTLSGKRKFTEIFQKGKKLFFDSGYVVFLTLSEKNQGAIYLGTIVRKKLGNAVERNRARRIIRETLRNIIRTEGGKGAFAIIFILNKVEIDSMEIKKVIQRVFSDISSHSGEKAN